MKKIEVDEAATKILIDPHAYESFIQRQRKYREENEKIINKDKYKPGSGNIWSSKITKPQNFELASEKKKSFHIKSVEKVIKIY